MSVEPLFLREFQIHSGDNLFNGRPDSFWEAGGSFPHWVEIDFRIPVAIEAYSLSSGPHATDSTTRMPRNWVLEGSNDKAGWNEMDARNNETDWKNSEEKCSARGEGWKYQGE